jgi:hypothetical protein
VYFYCDEYYEKGFSEHYYAYSVESNGKAVCFSIKQLVHYCPCNFYKSLDQSDQAIYVKSFNF